MIGFALVAVGYLVGSQLTRALERRGVKAGLCRLIRLGSAVAGGVAGLLVWRATEPGGVFALTTNVSDTLHKPLGFIGDLVAAALFVVTLLAIGLGIIVTAIVVTTLLASALAFVLGVRRGSGNYGHGHVDGASLPSRRGPRGPAVTSRREWRTAVGGYGQAVATAVDSQLPSPVDVEITLCGSHPEHLHLAADGVLADWDTFEGWSAMTLRGRHWYGDALVPPPEKIARWLRDVGTQPHLGVGWPREWYATGEVESVRQAQRGALAQLAALAASHNRPAPPSTPVVSKGAVHD